ncbi:hypothetical protein HanRHA438_Chr04g0192611 [Helianthus annuus]|nr:hypothetical protein HanIR_Chr04g0196801 [Helianthus annuus]KAJ0598176.1 hypothetical protein HanHA89_Chr04g0162891 [Helianthus annuus]KAJ0762459.1 hypothetical protein HanOQP8_Chr04g0161581 [Helianthus annuus]KAJ0928307.1 hypothetical protein HanRHA438_Chr04g0192611 [Helianthus annuus]
MKVMCLEVDLFMTVMTRVVNAVSQLRQHEKNVCIHFIFEVLYVLNTLMQTFQNKVLADAVTN